MNYREDLKNIETLKNLIALSPSYRADARKALRKIRKRIATFKHARKLLGQYPPTPFLSAMRTEGYFDEGCDEINDADNYLKGPPRRITATEVWENCMKFGRPTPSWKSCAENAAIIDKIRAKKERDEMAQGNDWWGIPEACKGSRDGGKKETRVKDPITGKYYPFRPMVKEDLVVGHVIEIDEHVPWCPFPVCNDYTIMPTKHSGSDFEIGEGYTASYSLTLGSVTVIGYKHIVEPEPELPEIGGYWLKMVPNSKGESGYVLEIENEGRVNTSYLEQILHAYEILDKEIGNAKWPVVIKVGCVEVPRDTIEQIVNIMLHEQEKGRS